MQFTLAATAVVALIGSTFAQTQGFDAILAPVKDQAVVADGRTPTTITWDPTASYNGQTVTIKLLQGATDKTLDFYKGADVASRIDSALGTFSWTPDSSIVGFATYGLKLQLDADPTVFQYSFPFKVVAGSGAGTGAQPSAPAPAAPPAAAPTNNANPAALLPPSAAPPAAAPTNNANPAALLPPSAAPPAAAPTYNAVPPALLPPSAAPPAGAPTYNAIPPALPPTSVAPPPTTHSAPAPYHGYSAVPPVKPATPGGDAAPPPPSAHKPTTPTYSNSTRLPVPTTTSSVVTAGAGRVVARGVVAVGGGLMAMLAL